MLRFLCFNNYSRKALPSFSISVQLIFIAFLILLLSASPNYICSSWRFCARLYPQYNQQFSSCPSNHFCVLKSFVSPIVILLFAVQWPWTYCSQRLLYTAIVLCFILYAVMAAWILLFSFLLFQSTWNQPFLHLFKSLLFSFSDFSEWFVFHTTAVDLSCFQTPSDIFLFICVCGQVKLCQYKQLRWVIFMQG